MAASATNVWRLDNDCARLQTAHGLWSVDIERLVSGLQWGQSSTLDRHNDDDADRSTRDRLLGIQVPGFPGRVPAAWLVDRYVRCNDFIATYERPHPDHLRVQVYWRYLRDDSHAAASGHRSIEGIHLIVSLQTDRLDRQPSVNVVSQLSGDQVRCLHVDAPSIAASELHASDDVDSAPSRASGRSSAVDGGETMVQSGRATDAPVWIVRQNEFDRSTVLMTLPADLVKVAFHRAGSGWRHEFHLLDEHLEKGVIRRAQVVAWWVPQSGDESWARARFARWCVEPPPLTT